MVEASDGGVRVQGFGRGVQSLLLEGWLIGLRPEGRRLGAAYGRLRLVEICYICKECYRHAGTVLFVVIVLPTY